MLIVLTMDEETHFGSLRARLRSGETLYGYILTIPSVRTARAVARSGVDFVIIDTEHNSVGPEAVHDLLLATSGTSCTPIVRIAAADHIYAKPPLDSGASGIFIPHVVSADQARRAVEAGRYPPAGRRGVGPYFALDRWNLDRDAYLAQANEAIIISVLIESAEGIDALPEILAVEGVDVISIARGDLAASVGRIGQEDHPDVLEQVRRAEELVKGAGKALAEVARRPDEVEQLVARGYQMICLGTDIAALANAAGLAVRSARGSAGPAVVRNL